MTFRVGMKVVCVDIGGMPYRMSSGPYIIPALTRVYTVRDILPGWTRNKRAALLLCEITNRVCFWDDNTISEIAFAARRFRPLVDTKFSFTTAIPADPNSASWDNRRRPVVEPMPVDGWRVSVKT